MRRLATAALAAIALLLGAVPARAVAPTTPTAIDITGGAASASQRLPAKQELFGLRVPLKQNAENDLTVTATGGDGAVATAGGITITQIALTEILLAKVESRRLSVPEIKQLVSEGIIDLADPVNFNVSVFDIVLTIGGQEVPVSVPVSKPIEEPTFATGPPITIGCASKPSDGITTTERTISIPCGDGGGTPPDQPPVQIVPFMLDVPDAPGVPPIPGVLVIEGRIKTLKEFFEVKLILANVSSLFTLSKVEAVLETPPGALGAVLPASGPVALADLAPGTLQSGAFVVRGDRIGVHTVTVHYGGLLSGFGIAEPIAVSGHASTDLEVKGPPPLDLKVQHPAFVNAGEPYTLTVQITNLSDDLPALYTSLELDIGADARLLDDQTDQPIRGPDVRTLGDILPGGSVTQTFRVLPLKTGPITSCTAGVSENLRLSMAFVGAAGPQCAVGTYPPETYDPLGRPTVRIVPTHNTTEVSTAAVVVALFSAQMIPETITSGYAGATFRVLDAAGVDVPAPLEISGTGSGKTIAILRPALQPAATYTVAVSPDVFDLDGRPLASGVTGRFTTVGFTPPVDTQAPLATLVVEPPVNPDAVPEGQHVPVRVEATDDLGVARIDLLVDGVFVDSRRDAPPARFMVDTTGFAAGSTHVVRAVAFDGRGNQGAIERTITVAGDTTPPVVVIEAAPTVREGRRLPATVRATDDGTVARLELFLDGAATPVLAGPMSPLVGSVDTVGIGGGSHTLVARARDGAGNVAEAVHVFDVGDDDEPPTVLLLAPLAGTEVVRGRPLSVLASAADDTRLASLALFLDGEAQPRALGESLTLDTAALGLGPHVIRARATDAAGNVGESTATFTVQEVLADTTPPAPPLVDGIAASAPVGGLTTVTGDAGTVEPDVVVEVTNLGNAARATAVAAADGAFVTILDAAGGQTLAIVAIDQAGNRSAAVLRVVPLPPLLIGIAVTPASIAFGPGTTHAQLAVVGTYSDGTQAAITNGVAFTSADPAVAAVTPTGLVAAGQNGSTAITVQVDGPVPASVPVTVAFPTVVGVEVTPAVVAIRDLGRTQQLAVAAVMSDGSRQPFPGTVTFGSAAPAIAGVSASGLVTGVAEGATEITVVAGAFAPVVVPVTVEQARLVALQVSPATLTFVGPGRTETLAVAALWSDGSVRPVTASFATSAAAVASVDAAGVVSSGVDGDATITVSAAGAPDVAVPVRVKSYQSIGLDPAAFTLIGTGKQRGLTVTATFTDGSTGAPQGPVAFTSDADAVATVAANGVVTSTGVGNATITATFQALTATATAQVIPRVADGLVVTPASVLLEAAGQTVALAVQAHFNDDTLGPPTAPVSFFVGNAAVATVSSAGVVTAVASGTTSINVVSGAAVATVPVTVDIPGEAQPPIIDQLDRPRAGEGDPVTLRGRFFAPLPQDNTVVIGSVPATVESARADQLVILVPRDAPSGEVTVTTAAGTSNAVPLAIYARQATSRVVTPAVDVAAAPNDVLPFVVADVDVRAGDRVLLSAAPDVLAPLVFDGTLHVRIDGGAPIVVSPGAAATELTGALVAGVHTFTVELGEAGGRIASDAIHLVVGPDATGPIAGTRRVIALAQTRPTAVTFMHLTDAGGTPLPDGAFVVATAEGGWELPNGNCCTGSRGGAVTNGTPSPDGFGLRLLQVVNGRVEVVYDPASAPPSEARSSHTATIAVLPANASGNRTSNRALATTTVELTSLDTVATPFSPSTLLADRIPKIAVVSVRGPRDTAGLPVPDGAPVVVSPIHSWDLPTGNCCTSSAGGTIRNGDASPDGFGLRGFTFSGGAAEVQYDPDPVLLQSGQTAIANLVFLPARPSFQRVSNRAFTVTPFPLSSAVIRAARINLVPSTLLADTGDNRLVATVTNITDALGNPVPDGTRLLATPSGGWDFPNGNCCTASAGGVVKNGTPSPDGFGLQCVTVTSGQAEIVYSDEGVGLDAGTTAVARLAILPADGGTCARIGNRALALAEITLAGYGSAAASITPTSVIADGLPKTVTVSLSGIRDVLGNPVPDGAKLNATAAGGWDFPNGNCCVASRGGTVTSGVAAPEGFGMRTHVVTGGQATLTYDPSPVLLNAAETATANLSLLPSRPNDTRIGNRTFLLVPIPLSSAQAAPANVSATPGSLLADFGDSRSTVLATDIRDAFGLPAPDGTRILMTPNAGWDFPGGNCCVPSEGGKMVDGTPAPDGFGLHGYLVTDGAVEGTYSSEPLGNAAGQSRTAQVSLLPGNATNGARIGNRTLALAPITLAGIASAVVEGPGQLAAGATGTYTVGDLVDTSGNPVPDGTRVAVTAQGSWDFPGGNCCTGGSGGTITNGEASPDGFGLKLFTVTNGEITFDFQAPSSGSSTLSLLPAHRGAGTRIGNRTFAIKVVGVTP